jgi:hypothetical protein
MRTRKFAKFIITALLFILTLSLAGKPISAREGLSPEPYHTRSEEQIEYLEQNRASGDFNGDGLLDHAVAVTGPKGPKVLLFISSHKENSEPEIIDLPAIATAITFGQLDKDRLMDLAIAAGKDLLIVHGRYEEPVDADQKIIERIPAPFSIAAIMVGDFRGDSQTELSLVSENGSVCLLQRKKRDNSWNVIFFSEPTSNDFTLNSCDALPIKIGENQGGYLKASDCRSAVKGNEFVADRYFFSGTAGQKLDIMLESKEFDSYLYLIDPTGAVVAQDDDSGPNTSAKITTTLKLNGTYIIETTSFNANRKGHYRLRLCFNGNSQPIIIGCKEE